MSTKTLHLIFDEDLPYQATEDTLTVICTDSGKSNGPGGLSRREFYADGYEETGREVCLWWHHQLSWKNSAGQSPHDLFEWDGLSTLWLTNAPIMYPDCWNFPLTMVALESIRLFRDGQIQAVHMAGGPEGLASVFQANGVPCIWTGPARKAPGALSIWQKGTRAFRAFSQWFLQSHLARLTHSGSHTPGQSDTLFYSTWFGEWQRPQGIHRYLGEEVHEIIASGLVQKARPFLGGCPPVRGETDDWKEFLRYSLNEQQAVYGQGYSSVQVAWRAKRWGKSLRNKVEQWLSGPPGGFGFLRDLDFRGLVIPVVRKAVDESVRAVIRYEALKKALQTTRPFALLLKDEVYTDGRLLVSAARAAGIRTVSLQHGTIYPTHWCYLMDGEASGLARPPLPDVFGVYGSAIAKLLAEKCGMPADILRMTGARRFRALNTGRASEAILAFQGGKPLVLVAGQMHQDMARIYEWAFAAADHCAGSRFVFKPHPRDIAIRETLRRFCAQRSNALYFEGPLSEVLPAASATVSGHSTVLWESTWLKIPALSVQISGEEPADWQVTPGTLRIVRSYEDLLSNLEGIEAGTLISEEDRRHTVDFLEDFLGFTRCQDPKALVDLFREDHPPAHE